MDLTKIPTQDLKNELIRRSKEKAEQRKNAVCCKNCVHRIIGNSIRSKLGSLSTWVCENRPKLTTSTQAELPAYIQTFFACSEEFTNNCDMFLHKNSRRGKYYLKHHRQNDIFPDVFNE